MNIKLLKELPNASIGDVFPVDPEGLVVIDHVIWSASTLLESGFAEEVKGEKSLEDRFKDIERTYPVTQETINELLKAAKEHRLRVFDKAKARWVSIPGQGSIESFSKYIRCALEED